MLFFFWCAIRLIRCSRLIQSATAIYLGHNQTEKWLSIHLSLSFSLFAFVGTFVSKNNLCVDERPFKSVQRIPFVGKKGYWLTINWCYSQLVSFFLSCWPFQMSSDHLNKSKFFNWLLLAQIVIVLQWEIVAFALGATKFLTKFSWLCIQRKSRRIKLFTEWPNWTWGDANEIALRIDSTCMNKSKLKRIQRKRILNEYATRMFVYNQTVYTRDSL